MFEGFDERAVSLLQKSDRLVVIRSVPFILTALAVALPARAGLINVGGEGQLLVGAAAAGVAATDVAPSAAGTLLGVAGADAGAGWFHFFHRR